MRPRPAENRRVLRADLGRLDSARGPEPWSDRDGALARIAGWGGNALGLAELLRLARADPAAEAPLVLTAGACVGRALPTAARASVLSRSPLTGLLAEGQIGGELGARIASHADALVLSGRTTLPGAVLFLGAEGRLRVEGRPELRGADPVATWRALEGASPGAAVLCTGPAGEEGVPYANLAGGGDPPRFVGRGGLGAVLGRLGLKALVVEERDGGRAPVHADDTRELVHALTSSPRLAARAADGTLELYGAFAARGDLRGKGYGAPLDPRRGAELLAEARAARSDREGCRGCPTPCGWVFERPGGGRQSAHFGASYALGTNLGLESFEDALVLLRACDRLGLDAKEVGAVLALACLAAERGLLPGRPGWGERERLLERIESIAASDERGAPLREGASRLARRLGLERELAQSRGDSARPDASHATVLGQCVTAGGSDPMKSFPFLIESSGRAGLERICTDLGPLPEGAGDPASPVAKGRLVYWHENLVSAVDMTGFCAFSTAGLLADGLCDVDRLARWILPPALAEPAADDWAVLSPGSRLLAAGANLALLRRELNRSWGAPPDQDRPEWAAGILAEPGMLDEYLAWRGLDAGGYPGAAVRARIGTPAVLHEAAAPEVTGVASEVVTPAALRAPGTVELRLVGSAGASARTTLALELPATVEEVLARATPGARARPAVWRRGQRLEEDEEVCDGDVLDLVTVIAGG